MSNPLLNPTKKVKREAKSGASNKRKLANAEEQPGGLLIVRAPSSSLPLGPKPPSKKFKSSQPSHSQPTSNPLHLSSSEPLRFNTPDADPALDDAVRAMESEAADLRRSSRGPPKTPDASGSAPNPKFRFPSQAEAPTTTRRGAGGGGKRRETIIDMSAPLPAVDDETHQIQRNKRLRAGAMAAIVSGTGSVDMVVDPITPPRAGSSSSHRRKSSVGARGKRISSSFQATGVITQPHNSVADTSFYKHIDADLPDSDRVRQLLIWCSARAAAASPSSPSSSSTNPDPPPPPLPALSAKAEHALKCVQEDIVRQLAERRVDLSLFGNHEEKEPQGELAANKQNVTNRTWEGIYGGDIQSAMEEEEAWKKVSYFYDTYARRMRSSIEKRRAALNSLDSASTAGAPSAKAQGKQRDLEPREEELPPSFQSGLRLARNVIARSRRKDAPLPVTDDTATPGAGPSTSMRKGADPDSRPLPTASSSQAYDLDLDVGVDVESRALASEAAQQQQQQRDADAAFDARLADVEFKLDHLYVLASQARATTDVAQLALDQRFEVLAHALDARSVGPSLPPLGVLGRYGAGGGGNTSYGVGGSRDERAEAEETLELLRALARVDAARPPAQVGDAVRRAVREVQRVGESGGVGVIGERRLTLLGGVGALMGGGAGGAGATPRKMPGTPRRGTTPRK
ncbi:hypothetical protein C0991_000483 [Blastosporella zonata]|nr:hypothetical protein C0991_000483 [Blastosporella zonata]